MSGMTEENKHLFNFAYINGVKEMEELYKEALVEDFIRSGKPTISSTRQKVKKCRRCKKKLKKKHVKYIFRIVKEGKRYRRTYCEDCVDELTQEELAEMEYRGSE